MHLKLDLICKREYCRIVGRANLPADYRKARLTHNPKGAEMRLSTRLLCAAAVIAMVSGCGAGNEPPKPLSSSMMKIERVGKEGHGSGVYIGNELVLTAAHVVDGQSRMKLFDDQGVEVWATVIWANKEYDVAALRPDRRDGRPNLSWMEVANLECRAPERGETVVAAGNPGVEDNLYIPGAIVGDLRESGPWKSVVLAALAISGGSSGGPVYDRQGDLVGIVVGVQLSPLQIGADAYVPSITGVAYVVPASAICSLLGREVVG